MAKSSDYQEPAKRGNVGKPGKSRQIRITRDNIISEKNQTIMEQDKEIKILRNGNDYLLKKLERIKRVIDGR